MGDRAAAVRVERGGAALGGAAPSVHRAADRDLAPETAKARAYDIVLNGFELGGGSVRIHRPDLQRKVFEALGLPSEEIDEKFGHLITAFRYGVPPHGGIAPGSTGS